MKSKKIKSQNKKVWVFAAAICVLVIIAVPFYISYGTKSYVFSNRVVFFVDNIFAQAPFLPKTPRQVLIRATRVNSNLESYKVDSNFKLISGENSLIMIDSQGTIVNPGQSNSQSSTEISGKLQYPLSEDFDFETRTFGEKLFFKVNEGVKISPINTTNMSGWYEMDLSQIQKDLKVDIRKENQISQDVSNEVSRLIDQIIRSDLRLSKKKESVNDYYKLETTLEKNPLSSIFLGANNSESTRLTMWVEPKTFFITKISLEPIKTDAKLATTFEYLITDHNRGINLKEPKEAKKVNNPVELYVLLTGKKSNANTLFAAIGGEAKDLSTTLLTIERLTKVILLIPKSL